MSTTGTYNEELDISDIISESFERIYKDPDALVQRHITTALRSLTLMFSSWENDGVSQFRVDTFVIASADGFTTGAESVTLNERVIRVLHAVHRDSDGIDTPLLRIGRMDYDYLAKKSQAGNRPDRFFVDKEIDAPIMYLWPVVNNDNDSLVVTCLVRHEDVGNMSNNLATERQWMDAVCAGLAARLAGKYAAEIEDKRTMQAMGAYAAARKADRGNAPTKFKMKAYGRRR